MPRRAAVLACDFPQHPLDWTRKPDRGGQAPARRRSPHPSSSGPQRRPPRCTAAPAPVVKEPGPAAGATTLITKQDLDEAIAQLAARQAAPSANAEEVARTKAGVGYVFSGLGLVALLMTVVAFTPPNLAILCSLAAAGLFV